MPLYCGFSWMGLVIFALPMLINIPFFVCERKDAGDKKALKEEPAQKPSPWEWVEQGSRIAYLIAVCVLICTESYDFASPLCWLGLVFLLLYYGVWLRYFTRGRDPVLLGAKLWFLPMPLAVLPVLYYLFAALWLNNWIAAGIMALFGVAHNVISYRSLYGKKQA